jgi:hypothetical protein
MISIEILDMTRKHTVFKDLKHIKGYIHFVNRWVMKESARGVKSIYHA